MANLGNADNLTGHHFSQANLFAFGRQAWDWKLDSRDIAEDWVRMTWSADDRVVDAIVEMMMGSWEALVSYQTPLGIGHQFRLQRPLRAQAGRVLHQGRLEPRLLQPGRQRGPRLRPLPDREQLHGAVLPGARAALREHRDGARRT